MNKDQILLKRFKSQNIKLIKTIKNLKTYKDACLQYVGDFVILPYLKISYMQQWRYLGAQLFSFIF
jgi:hypothetical protein